MKTDYSRVELQRNYGCPVPLVRARNELFVPDADGRGTDVTPLDKALKQVTRTESNWSSPIMPIKPGASLILRMRSLFGSLVNIHRSVKIPTSVTYPTTWSIGIGRSGRCMGQSLLPLVIAGRPLAITKQSHK